MLRQNAVAAVFVCAFAWPALAQDASDFMNGVYASSKADCDNLAKGGLSALSEGGAVLTSSGMQAYEYTCDFVDVKPRPGDSKGWFAQAICEEPGQTFPDIASITPADDSSVSATFMTDWVLSTTGQEDVGGGDTTGDDTTGDDSSGGSGSGSGSVKTPPSVEQSGKPKGSTGGSGSGSGGGGGSQAGDDQGGGDDQGAGDDQGGGDDQGAGGDDQGGGGDQGAGGDDQGAGGGDDTSSNPATQFFFCPNVDKASLK